MTRNQIDYLKHLETVRSNKAQEAIDSRKADAAMSQAESAASQALTAAGGLQETRRSNKAREAETYRSNVTKENIQLAYNTQSLAETQRSNIARETENIRHNTAAETENVRHNKASEALSLGTLNEQIRHNVSSESLERGKLEETTRHNMSTESLERDKLAETKRSNLVNEAIRWDSNQIGYAQVAASRYATDMNYDMRSRELMEASQHNAVMERAALSNADANMMNAETKKAELAYKPQLIQIEQQKADAASKQADAAHGKMVGSNITEGVKAAGVVSDAIRKWVYPYSK